VLERLNAEVNKLLSSAEVKENWAKQGTITMGMSIDQFDRFLRQDIRKWSKLVKSTGMKVD
ncbi:MAG: tripartite tricarboxylate transporter substrate binding protein, partial [Burkholderiales bacterium]